MIKTTGRIRAFVVPLFACVVLLVFTSAGTVQAFATSSQSKSWQVVSSPNTPASVNVLYGVAAFSANDAWAVGNYYQGNQMPNAALVEHWNGSQWSQVPAAYPSGFQHTFLYGIAAFSATDVWTVGFYDNGIMSPGYTLVEHWTGKKWKLVSAPTRVPIITYWVRLPLFQGHRHYGLRATPSMVQIPIPSSNTGMAQPGAYPHLLPLV